MPSKGLSALNNGAWMEEETGWGRTVSKELKSKVGQLITYSLSTNIMSQGRLGGRTIKNEQ